MFKKKIGIVFAVLVCMLCSAIGGYQFHAYQQEREAKAFFNIDKNQVRASSPQDFFDIGVTKTKKEK